MISRAGKAFLCFINKTGWFRLFTTIAGGIFVLGGLYATTLSRVEALETSVAKQEKVNVRVAKTNTKIQQDVAWIKGFLKQKLGDE